MEKQLLPLCFFRSMLRNFSDIHYRHMFLPNNSCFFAQEIFDNRKKKSKYMISCFMKGYVIYASTCDFKKVILNI